MKILNGQPGRQKKSLTLKIGAMKTCTYIPSGVRQSRRDVCRPYAWIQMRGQFFMRTTLSTVTDYPMDTKSHMDLSNKDQGKVKNGKER